MRTDACPCFAYRYEFGRGGEVIATGHMTPNANTKMNKSARYLLPLPYEPKERLPAGGFSRASP